MRIAALDIGEVRIGVAVCDSRETAAFPSGTLRRHGTLKKDIELVAEKLRELETEALVVGLPLSLNGDIGPQAQRIQGFCKALIKIMPIPMEYWDESMTSVEANDLLIEMGTSRARRREVIDQMAAVLILDGYLRDREHKMKSKTVS